MSSIIVFLLWLFWQVRALQFDSSGLVAQLLEYSALFAIMLLAILALYREWKSGIKHSRDQEQELRDLTERVVKAIEKNTAGLEDLAREIRKRNKDE